MNRLRLGWKSRCKLILIFKTLFFKLNIYVEGVKIRLPVELFFFYYDFTFRFGACKNNYNYAAFNDKLYMLH